MPCDYNKYPPNWFTEIRPRILARAGNCCEFPGCGLENNSVACSVKEKEKPTEWFKKPPPMYGKRGVQKKWVRVVLTVAHLDHDPENHEVKDDRLAAYCQLHHLRLDAEQKAAKRKGLLGAVARVTFSDPLSANWEHGPLPETITFKCGK